MTVPRLFRRWNAVDCELEPRDSAAPGLITSLHRRELGNADSNGLA